MDQDELLHDASIWCHANWSPDRLRELLDETEGGETDYNSLGVVAAMLMVMTAWHNLVERDNVP